MTLYSTKNVNKLYELIEILNKTNNMTNKRLITLRKLIQIQQKQIDELTKQVNHLRLNQVVRPDKIIKIPEMKK